MRIITVLELLWRRAYTKYQSPLVMMTRESWRTCRIQRQTVYVRSISSLHNSSSTVHVLPITCMLWQELILFFNSISIGMFNTDSRHGNTERVERHSNKYDYVMVIHKRDAIRLFTTHVLNVYYYVLIFPRFFTSDFYWKSHTFFSYLFWLSTLFRISRTRIPYIFLSDIIRVCKARSWILYTESSVYFL
jgi:hypothetical protein